MLRKKVTQLVDHPRFQHFIVALIVINSILIGLETSHTSMDKFGAIIDQIDLIILGVFIVEILLKVFAYRLGFFKNAWNLFDLAVILISVLPAANSFTVFRALRILRTLRLLKNMPKLRLIIESLLNAIPSIGWIAVLLMVIFYVFAVIGTNLFAVGYPEWFGTLGDTMFTLFQIMTLESWSSGIARPIIEEQPFAVIYFVINNRSGYTRPIIEEQPFAVIYFVIFILIATYTTLNIFIAVVVNTMNENHMKEIEKDIEEEEEHIKEFVRLENEYLLIKMDRLTDELQEIKKMIKESKK